MGFHRIIWGLPKLLFFPANVLTPNGGFQVMRSLPVLFAAGLFVLSQGSLSAGDEWPQFRGPDGTGHSSAMGLPLKWSESENITWKTAIPGDGHSSPVISGDQIWLTTALVNEISEEEQKRRLESAPNPRGLEIAGGVSLRAICVDRKTGKLLRNLELFNVENPGPIHSLNSYASPTPAIDGGRVYVHFGTYGTACVEMESGRVVWKDDSLNIDHQNGPGASPIVWKNLLIVHYDGIDRQFVAAREKRTGDLAWKVKRSGRLPQKHVFQKAYATPHVIEETDPPQLISPGSDWVYSYNPATGEELWRANYGKLGFSTVPRPVVGHGMVYIITSFVKSRLLALKYDGQGDVSETHVVWKSDRQVPQKPSALLVGDELYLVNDNGVGTCLDARTGEEHWTARLGGQYSASPVYGDGRIYAFSQDGKTLVLKPGNEYEVLAENHLDAGFMASPAVAGKALFLRTETHLYRVEE